MSGSRAARLDNIHVWCRSVTPVHDDEHAVCDAAARTVDTDSDEHIAHGETGRTGQPVS
jgi:hypothetical protein